MCLFFAAPMARSPGWVCSGGGAKQHCAEQPSPAPPHGQQSPFRACSAGGAKQTVSQTEWEPRPERDIDLNQEPSETRDSDSGGSPVG